MMNKQTIIITIFLAFVAVTEQAQMKEQSCHCSFICACRGIHQY